MVSLLYSACYQCLRSLFLKNSTDFNLWFLTCTARLHSWDFLYVKHPIIQSDNCPVAFSTWRNIRSQAGQRNQQELDFISALPAQHLLTIFCWLLHQRLHFVNVFGTVSRISYYLSFNSAPDSFLQCLILWGWGTFFLSSFILCGAVRIAKSCSGRTILRLPQCQKLLHCRTSGCARWGQKNKQKTLTFCCLAPFNSILISLPQS